MKFPKRGGLFVLSLAAFLTLLPSAFGQDFNMTLAPFNPFAIAPGEASSATISLGALNGFNGMVDLTCAITSDTSGTPPTCQVSPQSVQPSTNSGGATATITSNGSTTPALYKVAITGTSPGTTLTQSQNLTILSVTAQFTITVQTTVAPGSVPAGSGAQGVISVNPINGYVSPGGSSKGVTLSCASISPLVTFPPVCSFTYPNGAQGVPVNGTPNTATLTINTAGPITTGATASPRSLYALWIPLPMLALAGLGAAGGKRTRKAWGLLALFIVSGSLLLMPACGNSSTSSTTPNGVTPPNSYTFTIVGVDIDGNISSNTTSNGSNPSVTLTVTAPSKVP